MNRTSKTNSFLFLLFSFFLSPFHRPKKMDQRILRLRLRRSLVVSFRFLSSHDDGETDPQPFMMIDFFFFFFFHRIKPSMWNDFSIIIIFSRHRFISSRMLFNAHCRLVLLFKQKQRKKTDHSKSLRFIGVQTIVRFQASELSFDWWILASCRFSSWEWKCSNWLTTKFSFKEINLPWVNVDLQGKQMSFIRSTRFNFWLRTYVSRTCREQRWLERKHSCRRSHGAESPEREIYRWFEAFRSIRYF